MNGELVELVLASDLVLEEEAALETRGRPGAAVTLEWRWPEEEEDLAVIVACGPGSRLRWSSIPLGFCSSSELLRGSRSPLVM